MLVARRVRPTRQQSAGTLQFVPIRLDGRPGRRRTVPRRDWSGGEPRSSSGAGPSSASSTGDGPTRLAVRSQRAQRVVRRAAGLPARAREARALRHEPAASRASGSRPTGAAASSPCSSADGGRTGTCSSSASRAAPRLQRFSVRRGRARRLRSSARRRPPRTAGWRWRSCARRSSRRSDSVGYVVTVSPIGPRARHRDRRRWPASASHAASVTRGGGGAAGFTGYRTVPGTFAPRVPSELRADRRRTPARCGSAPAGPAGRGHHRRRDDVQPPRSRAGACGRQGRRVLASRLE